MRVEWLASWGAQCTGPRACQLGRSTQRCDLLPLLSCLQADSSEGEEEAAGGGGEESHEGCGPRARPQRRRQPTAAERQAAAEEAAASLAAELAERAAAEAAAAAAAAGPAAGVAGEGAAAQMAAQPACSPLQQMLYAALLERFDDELPDRLAPYFAAGQLDDTTLSQLVLSLCSAGVLPPGWPAGTPLLQRAMAMPAVAMAAAEAEAAGQGHVAAAEAAQAEEAEEAEAAGQGSMVPATAPPRVPALRVKVNVPALRQEAEAEELQVCGGRWVVARGRRLDGRHRMRLQRNPCRGQLLLSASRCPPGQIDEGEESDYEPPSSPPAPGTTPKHKAGTPRRKSKRVAAKRRQRAQAYGSDDEWVPR